jgi:hypothetical protein
MAKVDPCALLTRGETEAIMGSLDWKATPSNDNDPAFMLSCYYDELLRGDTPEKSLTVHVFPPFVRAPSYGGEVQHEAAVLIPRQEVGLESVDAVRYDKSDPVAVALPRCNAELPCVIAREGSDLLSLRLTVILPDTSAFRVEVSPQNLDYAKQIARAILKRVPTK